MERLRRSIPGIVWLICILLLGALALPYSFADTSSAAGADESWSMSLDVTTADPFINSGGVMFGMEPGATEGFDSGLDQAAPPNPPEGVDVFFWYPGNTGELRKLAVSYVGPAGEETWPLMINYFAMGPAEGDVSISWDPGAIPGGYTMFLDGVDMSGTSSHTFHAIVPESQTSQLFTFALTVFTEAEEEDTTPPYTSGHSPAAGATGAAPDTNIVVHVKDYGDGVDTATIVMTVEGVTVTPAVTGTAADYTLRYDPPAGFGYSQVVDVTIDATDLAGNAMAQDSYSFTTAEEEDTTPPYASGQTPAPAATGVAPDTNIVVHVEDDGYGVDLATIVMTVEGVTVTPAITGTAADYTLTYDPLADFACLQAVDVTIDATDLAGNAMVRDGYSFTIAEEEDTAPGPGGATEAGGGPGFEWWMLGAAAGALIVIGGGVYLIRGTQKKIYLFMLLALVAGFGAMPGSAVHASPGLIYVDADAGGANNGNSWTNAYNHLQDALATAVAGDQIWVAAGAYRPDQGGVYRPGDRTASFQLVDGVVMYGGFAGTEMSPNQRDWVTNPTILSGDLAGDDGPDFANNGENSYHIVTGSRVGPTATLDGFIISGGNANGPLYPDESGGGMYSYLGNPTLRNCTFSGNVANVGGAICNLQSHPELTACTFEHNHAKVDGGGMFNSRSSPTLFACSFRANKADGDGGGMGNYTPDPDLPANPTLHNCSFEGNEAQYGGAICNVTGNCTLINCTFGDNRADYGGALCNYEGSGVIAFGCIFTGNRAGEGGAIQNVYSSSAALANCTFGGNEAAYRGGGIYHSDSSLAMTNCVLWGNRDRGGTDESAQIHSESGPPPIVNYTCVQRWTGAFGGAGNIDDNPLFVDADGPDNITGTEDDNLRLSSDSPCIDAGDNTAVPPGVTTDVHGNKRIIDGDGDGVAVVDMGAYETLYVGVAFEFRLKQGWNLLSLPVDPDITDPEVILAETDYTGLWAWDEVQKRYVQPAGLAPGKGYWVLVPGDVSFTVSGMPVNDLSEGVPSGWVLMGSIIEEGTVETEPPDATQAAMYRWDPVDKRYQSTEVVQPGMGHWLLAFEPCTVDLQPVA